ncbi:MAG: bis(5'-nucleosyl)-tetraphosphatase (symmetrical) YqeK [Candidatus Margulisiibacteriota bacterium]
MNVALVGHPLPSEEDALHRLKPLLPVSRLAHCQRVADMAERIARAQGADLPKARMAGLVHDAAKALSPDEAQRLGIAIPDAVNALYEDYPATWHAFAAPAVLSSQFEITDPDILSACEWHTTGKADMSLLEKVVYVADYCEVGRSFPQRGAIETLALTQLDQAVFAVSWCVLKELANRVVRIHPSSLACYNFYLALSGNDGKMIAQNLP